MKKIVNILIVMLLVSIFLSTIAYPAMARARRIKDRDEVGDVFCPPMSNGAILIRVRTSAGGLSPAKRAEAISARLEKLFNAGLSKSDIKVERMRGHVVVTAKGQLIATADREHARLNKTTPEALAGEWADNIRMYLE